jgi:hypothetical protein
MYAAGGSVTLTGSSVTGNSARAGPGGAGGAGKSPGSGGVAGGGLYILPAASVVLDVATLDATAGNTASTSDPNIDGSYSTS